MAAGMDEPAGGVCVVCAKVVNAPMVSVHSSLIAQNGSIHSQMGQLVGMEQLEEACRASELVCSICLKLLLNVVNLECKLLVLKNEFRDTFLQGGQSRRAQVGGQAQPSTLSSVQDRKTTAGDTPQAGMWHSAPFDPCVRQEKVDSFFSNIPPDHNTEDVKSSEPQDNPPQNPVSPIKHEASSPESSVATTQQCHEELAAHLTTTDLSDLLPTQCLLGDDAVCSSQGEEESPGVKQPDCDVLMQENSLNRPSTDSTASPSKNTENEDETCDTVTTQEQHGDSQPLSDSDECSEGANTHPDQRRARSRGKKVFDV